MKTKPRELLEKEAKLLEYYNDVVHYLRAFNIDENLIDDAIQEVTIIIRLQGHPRPLQSNFFMP